ncbi:MAG TPA: hypothetical protein VFX79_01625 [Candidatus Saccharimonadales bacterium]|nr:hypothetical protein [Candidatus Saccharimonadales bacterium]
MEERKAPPPQRGNIDGIRPRRLSGENQPPDNVQVEGNSQKALGQQPDQNQQADKPAEKKPKSGKNLAVIIPAVIIFIGLSALAIYAGIQKNRDGQQGQETGSTQASKNEASNLIDKTINEIDQLNDQPDSSGEGLSDEKLGL